MEQIQRIKRSQPKVDRHGVYREACAELAEETGGDVESIWEEFTERAATRQYLAEADVDTAEQLALEDVRERYRRAS
jgi:hypothetical protein